MGLPACLGGQHSAHCPAWAAGHGSARGVNAAGPQASAPGGQEDFRSPLSPTPVYLSMRCVPVPVTALEGSEGAPLPLLRCV